MNPIIFVIAGKARAGKDTTGDYIVNYLTKIGYKPIKLAYARYLKMFIKDYFNWDGKEETKPRELLQELGTEVIRKKMNKPNFLVNRTCEDIEVLSNYFNAFIISDAREESEITIPKNKFNKVISIKINRDTNILTEKQKNHYTEVALDQFNDYDYIIENNGTFEELEKKVIDIVKENV